MFFNEKIGMKTFRRPDYGAELKEIILHFFAFRPQFQTPTLLPSVHSSSVRKRNIGSLRTITCPTCHTVKSTTYTTPMTPNVHYWYLELSFINSGQWFGFLTFRLSHNSPTKFNTHIFRCSVRPSFVQSQIQKQKLEELPPKIILYSDKIICLINRKFRHIPTPLKTFGKERQLMNCHRRINGKDLP